MAARLHGLSAEVKVVPMRMDGNRRAAARLGEIGGKRLFGREVEQALLAGNAEMALHSPNDLPAELPDGLLLAVYPERQAPHDMLVRSLR
jgi:hydroxymethylbilane synthase